MGEQQGSAVPRVGVQRSGGKLWHRVLLQPALAPHQSALTQGALLSERGWSRGQAKTPLHIGEPFCICGISTGMCVNVETAGIAHARVHMPSTNAEPLRSGGTVTARRAGGCPGLPTHRPGLAAGPLPSSAQSAQAESPWPTAASV